MRTSLSSVGALVDWVGAVVEDAGPLSLDSSLARMGKVAKTSSWLWETTPSSEESLGATEGFVALGATFLVFSFPSQLCQPTLPLLEDCWEEKGPR